MAEVAVDAEANTRVYVHNLPWSLTNEELANHFQSAGTVRYAEIMTANDGRSKGCAIVHYSTVAEANNAIATLTGSEIGGRTISVREDLGTGKHYAAAEGTSPTRGGRGGRGARGGRGGRGGATSAPREPREPREVREPREPRERAPRRPAGEPGTSVFVGNLAFAVQWQDLKDAFAEYKPTHADVKIGYDGRSRGWGIVQFGSPADAQRAIASMNGVEIQGRAVEVREDKGPTTSAPAAGEQ